MPGLQQDARHHRADAEAQIGGLPPAQFQRRAPRNHLFDTVFGQRKTAPWPHDLARNRGIIGRFGGLALVGVDHDQVDQMARHMHVMGPERPARRHPLDLRDHQTPVVLCGDRLFQPTQIGALVFIGQVAVFVRRGRANDGDIGDDIRKMQPGVAIEFAPEHDRIGRGAFIHRAAFADRIDEGFQPHLRQHAGTSRARIAVHVEQDARGNVIGRHPVFDHHPPDFRHRQRGRPRRIGPRDHPRQQPVPGNMVHALDAIHVTRRNRMQGGQAARAALGRETRADGGQHRIGAAQRRGRGYRHHRTVRDAGRGFGGGHEF